MNPVARPFTTPPSETLGNSVSRGFMVTVREVVDYVSVGSLLLDQLYRIEVPIHKPDLWKCPAPVRGYVVPKFIVRTLQFWHLCRCFEPGRSNPSRGVFVTQGRENLPQCSCLAVSTNGQSERRSKRSPSSTRQEYFGSHHCMREGRLCRI
jgi:hypothetical protein